MRQQPRIALCVGTIIAVLAVLGWFLGPSGTVRGVEFSPDSFSHRSFTYYQWCGIQVTPKQTHEWRTNIDDYIHENGFATDMNHDPPRWHLVKGFAPNVRGWSGVAKPMCQSMGCYEGSDRWVLWSNKHPELARIVWPQVVTWARNEQYGEIAMLFGLHSLESATTKDHVQEIIGIIKRQAQR